MTTWTTVSFWRRS